MVLLRIHHNLVQNQRFPYRDLPASRAQDVSVLLPYIALPPVDHHLPNRNCPGRLPWDTLRKNPGPSEQSYRKPLYHRVGDIYR